MEPLGRLEWRCRRGMKELDLLLVRYLRRRYSSAPSDERLAFAEILEYVRMAVILLRQEGAPAPAPADATRH